MSMRTKTWVSAAAGLMIAIFAGAGSIGPAIGPSPRSAGSALQGSAPQAARSRAPAPVPTKGEVTAAPQSQQEKEIRAFDALYVKDFDNADTKALGMRFTDDAEVVEEDGYRYQGRALIEERLAETFAASKGARLAIEVDAIRVLGPDVAKEEGRSKVTSAKGETLSHLRYTALLVKQNGNWAISSLREEHDPLVSPHDRLKVLGWMVGDWIDEGPDSVVRINCRWSEDENFLIRSFRVKHQGKEVMTVTQRIGWDPVAGQIRSWEFDSEGGFGEGRWGGDGDRWVVKHTATRPDGATVTATHITVKERPDLVRWSATDRFVGSESVADGENYAFVRVPPAPAASLDGPASLAPAKGERSPK